MQTFNLPETTHAFQLVRCDGKNNRFVYYEAITFPETNPRDAIDMYLRRASIEAKIGDGVESEYTLDILDNEACTLLELPIGRKGARYLISTLKIRVERD